MQWIRIAFLAALLPALSVSALAQQSAGAPAQRTPRAWQVDWGQYYCSMIRQAGPGGTFSAAIVTTPGGDSAQLFLIPEGSAPLPRGISSVVLMPGGRSYDISSTTEQRGSRRVLAISGLPYDFRDALADATELQLKARAEIRTRIPLAGARAAVAAHRRCTAEVSLQWGVDEAVLGALRQRPASTNLFGLTADDYPAAALRTATQGRVIVRIAVGVEGRATECVTVATSGSAAIDARTCEVIMTRARFRPALDAAGRPVAVRTISTVTWLIPG